MSCIQMQQIDAVKVAQKSLPIREPLEKITPVESVQVNPLLSQHII
jgi:hypothetical protein